MLQPKFIQLPIKTYFDIFWMPTVIFLSSIFFILIILTAKFLLLPIIISIIFLCFSLFWFGRIIYQLRFKTYEITIPQNQLFEVIDVLVIHENWNYGTIQDNLITLQITDRLKQPNYIIHILYFDDKLLIANTVNEATESKLFRDNDGLEAIEQLKYLLKKRQENNIVGFTSKVKLYLKKNYSIIQPLEIVRLFLSRMLSYSIVLVFVAAFFFAITGFFTKDNLVFEDVFMFIFQISGFGVAMFVGFIHLREDYRSYKKWQDDKKRK